MRLSQLLPHPTNTERVLRSKKAAETPGAIEDAVIKRVTAPKGTPAKRTRTKPAQASADLDKSAVKEPTRVAKPRAKKTPVDDQLSLSSKDSHNHQSQDEFQLDETLPSEVPITKFFVERKKLNKNFRKANSLVHHQPKQVMTPLQQKLTNILLRNAQNSEPIRELTWEIPVLDVLRHLKVESRNYEYIEKVILQMMNIKVKWDVLETKGTSKNYSVVFPYTKFLNGVITYEIQKDAAALLSNLESYTSLDMDEEMGLSKSCSIPIYENASRYLNIGHSRWFPWQQLRDMVLSSTDVPKNAQTWGAFNERYLGPAVKDVNSKTRLMVQIETEKVGRFVRSARLIVQRAKSSLNDSALNGTSATKGILVDSMRLLEVPDKTIGRILRDYDEEQIKLAIAHTKWRRSATHLKPLHKSAKYFTDTLKNRWYDDSPVGRGIGLSGELFPDPNQTSQDLAPTEAPATVTAAKRNSASKSEKDLGMEKMIQAVKAQRLIDIKLILGELNDKQTLALYADYNATLQTEAMHIKKGRNKAGVLSSFHHWYAVKTYGETISPEEILEYMARKIGASSKPL
ncbi:hypothetical protein P245_19610 [Comamonas thiooxydans]|uniref:Initiator Rep protein WH1 domain-containing protein n=1 Tax=Comamonas thiooxydans TaxID=363952 RepID=A0A0E3BYE2_9BURK|nr:hypothetical protein P245_19610 [Comamonas thiooxydans]